MNLDPIIQAQIDGHLITCSWFVRIDTTPEPIRAWFGVGDFDHIVDDVETDGGTYKGVGEIGEMPSLQQLVNGVASRIDLSISGVSQRIIDLINEDADSVRSCRVNIGLQFFSDLAPVGDTLWLWQGEADSLRTDSVSSPDFGRTRTATLSIGSATTGRRRPRFNNWTRVQQRARSILDAFCDRVSLYTRETTIKWPE